MYVKTLVSGKGKGNIPRCEEQIFRGYERCVAQTVALWDCTLLTYQIFSHGMSGTEDAGDAIYIDLYFYMSSRALHQPEEHARRVGR